MITKRTQTVWTNDKGRELIRLDQDGKATVSPHTCSVGELRDLAEACRLAADTMDLLSDPNSDEEMPTGGFTPSHSLMSATTPR